MNKMSGINDDFHFVSKDNSRIIIGYEKKQVSETLCTWYEVYLYKKQNRFIDFELVKKAILDDINAQTDEKILNGFDYTIKKGSDKDKQVKVWLSEANQTDIERMAYSSRTSFPVRHKIAEDNEGNAVYEEFESSEELKALSDSFTSYIHQCQEEGWQRKDSIDWNDYSVYFPVTNE